MVDCAGSGGPSLKYLGDWMAAYSTLPSCENDSAVRPMSPLSRPAGAIFWKLPGAPPLPET
jgi:hypothetical protein